MGWLANIADRVVVAEIMGSGKGDRCLGVADYLKPWREATFDFYAKDVSGDNIKIKTVSLACLKK